MLSQGFAADGDFATAAAGWNTAVATVQVLIDALAESGEVSRASIINAARSLDFHPDLFRDGISISTNGDADGFPIESFQVIQWSAESKTYTDIGDIHTEFEGTTRVE